MKKQKSKAWLIIVIIAIVAIIGIFFLLNELTVDELSTDEFLKKACIEVAVDENGVPVRSDNGEIIVLYNREAAKDASAIKKIVIDGYNLSGYIYKDGLGFVQRYTTSYGRGSESIVFSDKIIDLLYANGVSVDYTDPNEGSVWSSLLMPVLVVGAGIVLLMIMMRSVNGSNKSAMDFGKTKARVNQNVKVRFSDVAGAEE